MGIMDDKGIIKETWDEGIGSKIAIIVIALMILFFIFLVVGIIVDSFRASYVCKDKGYDSGEISGKYFVCKKLVGRELIEHYYPNTKGLIGLMGGN